MNFESCGITSDMNNFSQITVVIVDSGVNNDSTLFVNDNLEGFTYGNGEVIKDFKDEYGHGTAVYNILRKIDGLRIINIKLKNIENGVDEEELIQVLEYINNHIFCNIINLSLGVSICNEYERLNSICECITSKGIIMVASFDNFGSMTYPAALPSVIGVAEGSYCNKITEFEYYNDEVVNIGAKSSIQRVAWTNPQYIFIGGNSFACVHVTSYIAKLMKRGIFNKEDILENIKKDSIFVRNKEEIKETHNNEIFNIKKAAIFPFNKEMHSLVRFSELLPFEISNVYDVRYSGLVGSTTNHVLKNESLMSRTIENIDKIDWNVFDTLIIGHLEQLERYIDKNKLMEELLMKAIQNRKKVYCFDNVSRYITDDNRDYIKYPAVTKENLIWNHCGKLYRYSKPVLGIFGTSSQQGKFTLQLTLRKHFLKEGYNIGQIGTEPNSLLFGMEYVYPMGYNSSVYIQGYDSILYLNYIVNELCKQDKDIIIVGSQSGTITYDEGNLQQYTIQQYNFLLGTQPEAIILCVNPYDEFNYIHRTIKFIESSIDAKVISLVVFPKDIKKNWEGMYGSKEAISDEKYEEIKEKLFNEFARPTYKLSDSTDMERLFTQIVDYYSE